MSKEFKSYEEVMKEKTRAREINRYVSKITQKKLALELDNG